MPISIKALCSRSLALVSLLSISCAAPAETARCTKVIDGDSLVLRLSFGDQESRLAGIDAPEKAQRFGAEATLALAELVLDQTVEVSVVGADTYGRFLVRVVKDGLNVNSEMVRRGLAWHFTKYSSDAELAQAESVARRRHLGLWVDEGPTPPWEFRHPGALTVVPRNQSVVSGKRALLAPTAGQEVLHGNRSSRVFHFPTCSNYECRNCTAVFASEDEAIRAGFRPAGCCARRPKG